MIRDIYSKAAETKYRLLDIQRDLMEDSYPIMTFSGGQGAILFHLIADSQFALLRSKLVVVMIDTGRLFEETRIYIDKLQKRYEFKLKVLTPNNFEVGNLIEQQGLYGFRDQGHEECCGIRKVNTFNDFITSEPCVSHWITGGHADPTRQGLREKEGFTLDIGAMILKCNPLFDWTFEEIMAYARIHNVPMNPLFDKGYTSIGCECCTVPTFTNDPAKLRSGRWVWEGDQASKECGLNVKR